MPKKTIRLRIAVNILRNAIASPVHDPELAPGIVASAVFLSDSAYFPYRTPEDIKAQLIAYVATGQGQNPFPE